MAPSWKFCYPQAGPVEGQSLQQKEEKRRKRKGEKLLPSPAKILSCAHARAKMS